LAYNITATKGKLLPKSIYAMPRFIGKKSVGTAHGSMLGVA